MGKRVFSEERYQKAKAKFNEKRLTAGDANQRARMKQLVKVVVIAVVAGGIAFLALGGWSWLAGEQAEQAAKDPLVSLVPWFYACADGTCYMADYEGRAFWIVGGKAAAVACTDKLESWGDWHSDAKGGVYVIGEQHLWYLFKGTATQVKQVPTSEILEDEHRVNNHTVTWSVMNTFGQMAAE